MQEYKFKPYTVEDFNQGSRKVIYRITGNPWDVADLRLPKGDEIDATVDLTKDKPDYTGKLTVNIENLWLAPHLVMYGKPVYKGDQVWIDGLRVDEGISVIFEGLVVFDYCYDTHICSVKIIANDDVFETRITTDMLRLVAVDTVTQQTGLSLEQKLDRAKASVQRASFNLSSLKSIKHLLVK